MKLGGIEFGDVLGGYEIINIPASSLPQDAASAVFGAINSGLLGATYVPIWYVGYQIVNGKNHLFLCKEVRVTKNRDTKIVGLVINTPPSKNNDGSGSRVARIIEEADLSKELKIIFESATKSLIGVGYRPLFYIGKQVVRGMNYYFLAEARIMYPDSEPFLVEICVNEFNSQISVVSIEKVEDVKEESKLGYSFSW